MEKENPFQFNISGNLINNNNDNNNNNNNNNILNNSNNPQEWFSSSFNLPFQDSDFSSDFYNCTLINEHQPQPCLENYLEAKIEHSPSTNFECSHSLVSLDSVQVGNEKKEHTKYKRALQPEKTPKCKKRQSFEDSDSVLPLSPLSFTTDAAANENTPSIPFKQEEPGQLQPQDHQVPPQAGETSCANTCGTCIKIDLQWSEYLGEREQTSTKSKKEKKKRRCTNCKTTCSPIWRFGVNNEVLCNACGLYYKQHKKNRPQSIQKKGQLKGEVYHDPTIFCARCGSVKTSIWRRGLEGQRLCNACGIKTRYKNRNKTSSQTTSVSSSPITTATTSTNVPVDVTSTTSAIAVSPAISTSVEKKTRTTKNTRSKKTSKKNSPPLSESIEDSSAVVSNLLLKTKEQQNETLGFLRGVGGGASMVSIGKNSTLSDHIQKYYNSSPIDDLSWCDATTPATSDYEIEMDRNIAFEAFPYLQDLQ